MLLLNIAIELRILDKYWSSKLLDCRSSNQEQLDYIDVASYFCACISSAFRRVYCRQRLDILLLLGLNVSRRCYTLICSVIAAYTH